MYVLQSNNHAILKSTLPASSSSVVGTLLLVFEITLSDYPQISFFAEATLHPDWASEFIESEFPIHQRYLSQCIDDVSYSQLLITSALDSRFLALILSSFLPYTGEWLILLCHSLHLVYIYAKFLPCLQYLLEICIYGEE